MIEKKSSLFFFTISIKTTSLAARINPTRFLRDIYIVGRIAAIPTNLLFMLFRCPGPRPVVIRATNQKLSSKQHRAEGATSGGGDLGFIPCRGGEGKLGSLETDDEAEGGGGDRKGGGTMEDIYIRASLLLLLLLLGRPFRLLTFHRVDHGMRARVLLFGERRGKRALDFAAP